ncbi:hypothetical protein HOC32_03860 [Candidatus Woesearchaeota archaeon]|jgi:hypothetical protein|nr:hypothetical protein [Candidatus Woesearchaeota archaeon]
MIEAIIYYLILLDVIIYNLLAWLDGKWYKKNFRLFSRQFPLTKGFGIYYFVLVLWIGLALWRLNVLPW